MGKKSDVRAGGAPEFHLVVRRPHRKGPLAPYRFTITVVFAFAVAGSALWTAARTGVGTDPALIRFGVSALFAWIVVGRVSSILGSGERPEYRSPPGDTAGSDQELAEQT